MPLPLNAIIQTTLNYEHFAQRLMNVIHWRVTGIGISDENILMQQIADQMGDTTVVGSFASVMQALVPSTCTLLNLRAQRITPGRMAYFQKDINDVGLRGASKSANVNSVITKRTDAAGRNQVGDVYIPGLAAADQLDGFLTVPMLAVLNTSKSFFYQGFTLATEPTVTLKPCIFHRATGNASDITSAVVQPEVRVMTRRTVGRGI